MGNELRVGEGRVSVYKKGFNECFHPEVKEGEAFITVRIEDTPPDVEGDEPMPFYQDFKLIKGGR